MGTEAFVKNAHEILSIEDRGIKQSSPAVDQEAEQVRVICMSYALPQQHTVVISSQDTDIAVVAVLAAWWHMSLARVAVLPAFSQRAVSQEHPSNAGICLHKCHHI